MSCLCKIPLSLLVLGARARAHLLSSPSPCKQKYEAHLSSSLLASSQRTTPEPIYRRPTFSAQPCPCTPPSPPLPTPPTPTHTTLPIHPLPHEPPLSPTTPQPSSKKKKKYGHLPFFINNGQRPLHPHTPPPTPSGASHVVRTVMVRQCSCP